MDTRVIFENDTTLTDISVNANDYFSGTDTIDVVAADDFIYLGSRFPFNSLYFKFGTANTASSVLSASIWDGGTWRSVAELFDSTALSGATFGQNGYIEWVPDRQYGWGRSDTVSSGGSELITGLGNITIYDHYWVRLAVSADLDVGTTFSWVGSLFSNDDDLGAKFPDLVRSNTIDAWESGKTTWEEQHVEAARSVSRNLRNRRLIFSKDQILDRRDYVDAAVFKVAEIAFRGMGPSFAESRDDAKKNFEGIMNETKGKLDKDQDGQVDREEVGFNQMTLTRGRNIGAGGF